MNPLPQGRSECGICGYPAGGSNDSQYLPTGTVLSDRYLVGKLLEQAGDAAVYLGYDQVLKSPIYIREFFPDTLCERAENGQLHIISGCENTFRDFFDKFRSHARTLARMRELPSIIPVYDIFDQNHTAYTVAEFCEGNSLETRLSQMGGRMKWEEARPLFMPLMASLISLHSAGLYHFGISPEALVVGTDGKLHLHGFSIPEARRVSSDLRPRLLSGYSAPEQYSLGEELGAYTDVYGLAATIFRALTGNPPPMGSRRSRSSDDLLVPSDVAEELPDYVAVALFNALQVTVENRTATIERFRDQLSTAPAVSRLLEDEPAGEEIVETDEELPEKTNSRTKYAVMIVLAVFVVLLLLAGLVILWLFPEKFGGGDDTSTTSNSVVIITPTDTTTTTTVALEDKYAADNLVGQNYFDVREQTTQGKFKIVVEAKQYSDKEKGTILSQNPNPETPLSKGATIKVVISDGPENVTVPDVAGWNYQQAEAYLKALGFRVEVMRVVSETVDRDLVESVSNAGESLPEGTKLTLRVSETTLTTTTAEPTNWWD